MNTCNDCIHKPVCYRTDSVSSSYADKCGDFKSEMTGHWIDANVWGLFSNYFKCSECGNLLDFNGVNCGRGDANFCPNCGADMRKEQT